MSEVVVATVESVVGTVIARDEDGNTRVLQPGDEIFYGEEVIAEDGAFIEMAFEDGSTMSLAGNESATITDDLAESAEPAPEEAEIADATVEEIIAALDRGEDITDIIEAPAAGADGGAAGEGGSFVRIARGSEEVDPISYAYDANVLRGPGEAEGGDSGILGGGPEADEDVAEPGEDVSSGAITVSSFTYAPSEGLPIRGGQTEEMMFAATMEVGGGQSVLATISGSTEDIPAGSSVLLTITDSNGNSVDYGSADGQEVEVQEDGSWIAINVDISELTPGELQIEGFVVDQTGDEQSDELEAEFTLPAVEISDFGFAPEGFAGGEGGEPNASLAVSASDATSVTVFVNGSDGSNQLVEATQDDGDWVVDLADLDFEEGVEYTASAQASDDLGFIDVSGDLDASFDLPTVGVSFELGSENNEVSAEISGTSSNATSIDVGVSGGGMDETFTVAPEGDGTWSVPDEDLEALDFQDGETYEVTATASDEDGNTDEATATGAFDLPTVGVSFELGSENNEVSVEISGTSSNATSIEVVVSGEGVDDATFTVTPDGEGNWSVPDEDLEALDFQGGETYEVTATASDENGNTDEASDTAGPFDLPTVAVSFDASGEPLASGEETTVTIDFSEVAYDLDGEELDADGLEALLVVEGGELSDLAQSDTDDTVWTATFTPEDGETQGSVAVPDGSYADAAGNLGSDGSDSIAIDTEAPTVTVSFD
ncbi:retention module-containing protein, partial [Thioalkalivibrio sp. ARh3]|uniref:retention module-containing protein n=1 Tax=Thioalkalivibrio sp. ARh3 TaxID=1158148 RepID=UPI001E4EC114